MKSEISKRAANIASGSTRCGTIVRAECRVYPYSVPRGCPDKDGTCGTFKGKRCDYSMREAIDFECDEGSVIYAPFDGEMTYYMPFAGEKYKECADRGVRIEGTGVWQGYYALIFTMIPDTFGGQVKAADRIGAVSGSGGWPMNVFLTPNLQPITGGTYFPPDDNFGRTGFGSILKMVADQWTTNQHDVMQQGKRLEDARKRGLAVKQLNVPTTEAVLAACYGNLDSIFDETRGGFGTAPKFPKCVDLDFLLTLIANEPDSERGKHSKEMLGRTLDAIARGGIHDHIGKGFHRYSVDVACSSF